MRTRFLIRSTLADLASLFAAMAVASLYVFGTVLPWNSGVPGAARSEPMVIYAILSLVLFSLITSQMSGPGVPRPSYGRMFAIFLGTGGLMALLLLFTRAYFSRPFLLITAVGWLVLATTHRMIRRRRPWTERIAVITGEKQLADDVADSPHADVIWVLDPKSESVPDLPDRNVTMAVDLKVVLSERVAQYISSCDVAGYTIRPFTSVYEEHTGRVPLVHLAEGWEISAPLLEVAPWLPGKRVVETLATAITAPIWATLAGIVAISLKLGTRGGPALFKQERVGFGGEPFIMYKFRSMAVDAEKDGPSFASERDHRLIRGGRFLRKSRLDEIPQLWNVLKGDMSLVGPRAEQVPFADQFTHQIPFYAHRHLVRPGVTGWAQVNYGYADDQAETVEKLTYDLYYIKHMSPVMDLRVLWKSVWTVMTGFGAR
jgi:lipopolysaccharide/colanic/teichoic acid biosynthesis glycosyltransferase